MSPSLRSPDHAHGTDPPDPDGFWRFAVTAWEQPAVRERLLRWQASHGIDVIFLLFAIWLQNPLVPQRWADLRMGSHQWHITVTRRIRTLRGRIRKAEWPQGYKDILALELASERIEATWLASAAGITRSPMQRLDLAGRMQRLFPDLPTAERTALVAAIRPAI